MSYRTVASTVTTMLFLASSAVAQEEQPGKAKARWITVAEHGLKVKLPAGWQETEQPGAVLAAARTDKDASGQNLNIRSVRGVTAAIIQAKAFAQQLRKGFAESLEGYVAAGDGVTEIAGNPALWLRGSIADNQVLHYIFVGRGVGFIATFVHPTDQAEQSVKAVESIVDSIGIGPKEAGATKERVAKSEPKDLGAEVVKGRVQAAHGFSLKMPKGWQLTEASSGAFLAMAGPDGMSINVRKELALTSKLDPKVVAAEMEPVLKKAVGPDYEIRSSREVRIARRVCVWMDAKFSQQDRKLANLQLLLPGKAHGFIVTFTAPAKAYPKNIGKVKKALRTIRID